MKGVLILIYYLLQIVPMQCTDNFGLLSFKKVSSHRTSPPSFLFFLPLCAVFLCFHTNGCEVCYFTTDEYGSFNVCTNLVHAIHTGTCKQVCTIYICDIKLRIFFHWERCIFLWVLIQSSDRPSMLVICGDHGMSDQGGHGGASAGETSVPLIMISPHTQFQPQQGKASKQNS